MAGKTHVPDGWRLVRAGERWRKVVMGQAPPGTTVFDWKDQHGSDAGLPFIQGNAEFERRFPQPVKWCTEPLKTARRGDALISVRAPVGETNRSDCPLAIGRGLAAIRFIAADLSYGWHILNHAKQAFGRVTQGSTFNAIGIKEVRSLHILLPPRRSSRPSPPCWTPLTRPSRAPRRSSPPPSACGTPYSIGCSPAADSPASTPNGGTRQAWGPYRQAGEVVRLEEVAEVRGGVGFPLDKQGHRSGSYPFIKVSDMNLKGNQTYIRNANNYINQQEADELGANIFTSGTTVFPKVGEAIATNKKRILTELTIIDNNMIGITVSDTEKCDARFFTDGSSQLTCRSSPMSARCHQSPVRV